MIDYQEFIANKKRLAKPFGFSRVASKCDRMKDFQSTATDWLIERGRAACFADTGLGKTLMQLDWAANVWQHTRKPVVIHCPVGVRHQTKLEAIKFGIDAPVEIVDEQHEVVDGINLVNYEKMHHFNPTVWGGVVLDESSVLKNFTGKIKRQLIEAYRATRYKLACTATPAPNDHMELGNHADFLGVMPSNEMLSRWFINDTMKAGGYRLKHHGQEDFWRWVASWAVCIGKPSDIGGSDAGYDLPPLNVIRHIVTVDHTPSADGLLFDVHGISATNLHEEKRRTNHARACKTAELVSGFDDSVLIWCHTNYEADELRKVIDGAVDLRGCESEKEKARKLQGFADGSIRVLVTKPEIAGMGLNFQICNKQIFNGIGFSFESYYQAVRRCWRFGQTRPVDVHLIVSDAESAIEKTIARKEADHVLMQQGMSVAMRAATRDSVIGELSRDVYVPTEEIRLPNWLEKEI